MDDKLTKQLQDWLSAEDRDVTVGAELLYRLNRNRFLYHNILRAPERFHDKLEYELKKHLQIRLDGKTLRAGIRPDHDTLPPDIQAIPERNKVLYYKIKQIYNTLLSILTTKHYQ